MTQILCDICGKPTTPGRQQTSIKDKLIQFPSVNVFTVELLIQFPTRPSTAPDLCRSCLAGCATHLARHLADTDIRIKEIEASLEQSPS